MNVKVYLITEVFVSIIDTRLRLPTATFLTGKECSKDMQLELYYELLGQARHQT